MMMSDQRGLGVGSSLMRWLGWIVMGVGICACTPKEAVVHVPEPGPRENQATQSSQQWRRANGAQGSQPVSYTHL